MKELTEYYQLHLTTISQARGVFFSISRQLQTCSPLPVIIYNVPGRTCSNISSDTCLELAHECENIVAVKEASGDMAQIMRIIKGKPENFLVISGDDMLTLPVIAAGGSGVISVLANAFPAECSELVSMALKNNFKAAREIQFRFIESIELLFADGNPSGVKAFLSIMNLCQNNLRLPLVPVNKTIFSRIQKATGRGQINIMVRSGSCIHLSCGACCRP